MAPANEVVPKCSACIDLAYQYFKDHGQEVAISTNEDVERRPRYHFTEFPNIRRAAMSGCELCDILCKGMSAFWGPDWAVESIHRDREIETMVKEDEINDSNDVNDVFNGEQEGDRSYRDRLNPNLAWIGMQQIPGRPLQLLRCGKWASGESGVFGSMTMRLEFYTESGMHTPKNRS